MNYSPFANYKNILSLLFAIYFLTIFHQTKGFVSSKNVYTFGSSYYTGFPLNIVSSQATPIDNPLLTKFLFNGTDSYKIATGNETLNTSVKLQQLVPGSTVVFYVMEYFNTDTNSSLGQMILVTGNNENGQGAIKKPPNVMSTPEPIYIYTTDGQTLNPFNNVNRIEYMSCLFSCLIVSTNGNVYLHIGVQETGITGTWNILFPAVSYTDPNNGQLLNNVKFVYAAIGGFYKCETYFAITNYGHVFSAGCHNYGLRGTAEGLADGVGYIVPSLRNITAISVGFMDGDGESKKGKTAAAAIDVDGVLWTWGSNLNGMLGLNSSFSTLNYTQTAQQVSLISNKVTKVSIGLEHVLVMTLNGDVLCFGGNSNKQCDYQSSETAIMAPTKIDAVTGATDCVAQVYVSACILAGNIKSWGANFGIYLNLGHGSPPVFDDVSGGGSTVSSLYLTGVSGIAFTSDNKVKVWGSNANGMLAMGDDFHVQYPRKLTTTLGLSYSNASVISVKTGRLCTLLLTTLGNDTSTNILEYWGDCNYGLNFNVPSITPMAAPQSLTSKKVISIDFTEYTAIALVENGDLYFWGYGIYINQVQTNSVPLLMYSNVKLATVSSGNIYVLLNNGTLLGVGDNSKWQLGNTGSASYSFIPLNTSIIDSNNETIVQIQGGTLMLYVLTDKGNVYGIGLNIGSSHYLSPTATEKFSTFMRINGNIKVRKMFIGFYSAPVLVSTSGVPYYFDGVPIKVNLPTDDSYLINAFMYDPTKLYFITKKGSIYTAGPNYVFTTSYRKGFSPDISAPFLYKTKDYFEGVPYMGLAGYQHAGIITRDEYSCFGVNSTNPSVCSSHGFCSDIDTCTCDEGYSGVTCSEFSCDSISYTNSSSVCSGRGQCTAPETCSNCTNSSGTYCQYPICYGTYSNIASVCSGNGFCTSINKCNCKVGFYGSKCQYRSCFGGVNGQLPIQTVADVFCANINRLLK